MYDLTDFANPVHVYIRMAATEAAYTLPYIIYNSSEIQSLDHLESRPTCGGVSRVVWETDRQAGFLDGPFVCAPKIRHPVLSNRTYPRVYIYIYNMLYIYARVCFCVSIYDIHADESTGVVAGTCLPCVHGGEVKIKEEKFGEKKKYKPL